MKRWIKVNKKWIDTLQMVKEGYYYYELDNLIWCLPDNGEDYVVGKLEKETDDKEEVK